MRGVDKKEGRGMDKKEGGRGGDKKGGIGVDKKGIRGCIASPRKHPPLTLSWSQKCLSRRW